MIIETPNCPTCGQPAVGTLETVQAIAELGEIRADGSCEYTGTTTHLTETQESVRVIDKSVLVCANHHDWQSTITEV